MIYKSGLFLESIGDAYKSVIDLINKLGILWVDKENGVPKITGLTKTVVPSHNGCTTSLEIDTRLNQNNRAL